MYLERVLGEKIENTILSRLQAAKRYQLSPLTKRPEFFNIISLFPRFGKGNNCNSMILRQLLNKTIVTNSIPAMWWKWAPKT
jgi:GH24 family phage-related lysozyme (muramidase)